MLCRAVRNGSFVFVVGIGVWVEKWFSSFNLAIKKYNIIYKFKDGLKSSSVAKPLVAQVWAQTQSLSVVRRLFCRWKLSLRIAVQNHGVGMVLSILEAANRSHAIHAEHASHGFFLKCMYPKMRMKEKIKEDALKLKIDIKIRMALDQHFLMHHTIVLLCWWPVHRLRGKLSMRRVRRMKMTTS